MGNLTAEAQALLVRAVELTRREREERKAADAALTARDEAITMAHEAGVTMYRLSQETGLSKTATRAAVLRARGA